MVIGHDQDFIICLAYDETGSAAFYFILLGTRSEAGEAEHPEIILQLLCGFGGDGHHGRHGLLYDIRYAL